jgi:serine/threonine-protein kinase
MDLREHLQFSLGNAYTLERELGGGGMSRVFVAEEAALGRRVVVKVLAPELAHELSAERFAREIRLAASLQHANIVPVHSAGVTGGVPYYTMPLVEGRSLRERLAEAHGQLPLTESIGILRDVARALDYAQARGVVHRDIKPENVLLSGGAAVVTDFGIAKAVSDSRTAAGATLTSVGTALGTPAYMAPEQVAGDDVDARADLYAWGVMAYELLAGVHPFAGKGNSQQLLAAHLAESAVPLAARAPQVPDALTTLVMRCLAKGAPERPQSARELVEVLDGVSVTPGAGVPTRTTNTRAATRLVIGGALVALAAGLVGVLGPRARATPEAPSGVPPHDTAAPRILVLPLENRGVARDEFFADGMTDAIRGQLAENAALAVLGPGAASRYKRTTKTPREIARDLGVRYLLTGTVEWDGAPGASSRVRISPELVDALDETTKWRQSFDTVLVNVFAVQSAIARSAGGAIAAALGARDGAVARGAATVAAPRGANLTAYTLYLKALAEYRHFSDADIAAAEADLRRALATDSSYAPANALLAQLLVWNDPGVVPPRQSLREAAKFARRALALDSNLADAHVARGMVQWFAEWNFAGADSSFRRAIELEPSSGNALGGYAFFLTGAGRLEEAVTVGRRAASLDPIWAGDAAFRALLALGRYDELLRDAYAGLALDSLSVSSDYRWYIAAVLLARGQKDAGLALLRREALVRSGDSTIYDPASLAEAGRTAEARGRLAELIARCGANSGCAGGIASGYAYLGDHARALDWLERAYEVRHTSLVGYGRHWALAPLRQEPRYKAIMAKVGLPP